MFSFNTSKLLNQHPQINFSYHISPDVTIEFLKQKSHDDVIEDEIQADDDEDFDYFNPLVYCAITMDEDDEPSLIGDLNTSKPPSKTPDTSLRAKKPSKSNENSSFVCNSADTTTSNGVKKKRFSCHICSKTFGWTTDLKRHILIHTGERPFKCTMCFATFTRNFLLQKHKTKIHQCLSPNEISQLNNNVAKNLMEIKLKMREIENAKDGEDEKSDKRRPSKKQKTE